MASILDFVTIDIQSDGLNIAMIHAKGETFNLRTNAQMKAFDVFQCMLSEAFSNGIKVRVNGIVQTPHSMWEKIEAIIHEHEWVKCHNMVTFI